MGIIGWPNVWRKLGQNITPPLFIYQHILRWHIVRRIWMHSYNIRNEWQCGNWKLLKKPWNTIVGCDDEYLHFALLIFPPGFYSRFSAHTGNKPVSTELSRWLQSSREWPYLIPCNFCYFIQKEQWTLPFKITFAVWMIIIIRYHSLKKKYHQQKTNWKQLCQAWRDTRYQQY